MEKKWNIRDRIDKTRVEQFRSELKIDPIVAELLLQRNVSNYDDAEAFFRPKLEELHDPFLMKDLEKAVQRLMKAMQQNQRILFFGDYDVDGTTAVALMYSFFSSIYSNIDFYIPDRYKEGYGLSADGILYAKETEVSLIVALDCGIKSVELVEYAKSLEIDFIICDHHEPGEQVPNCLVLDPKQADCSYPYKELCGCGVGFKLLQGFCQKAKVPLNELYQYLDFVAISIGADIVPVTGENRILAHHGIRMLNEEPRVSFHTLLKLAKKSFPVTLTDVVFSIAPRINAAGRIHSGRIAVELMTTKDLDTIRKIANEIDAYNTQRRELDADITQEALSQIQNDLTYNTKKSTVVFSESWHKGVVGIVASRLIETHFRPTIVLTAHEGKITGSARTINQFDIYNAISACDHLLDQFGGHKHAAGLTLKQENLIPFIHQFDEIVQNTIAQDDLVPMEHVDIEIEFNSIFTSLENRMQIPKLKRILKQLEPHGPGNMKPVFVTKNAFSVDVSVLKEKHLKLRITQPNTDIVIDAIGFNMADKLDLVAAGLPFDILYTMESNYWNEKETLQLNLKDIRSTL